MDTVTAPRRVVRLACARCGENDRIGTLYLCHSCAREDTTAREMEAAELAVGKPFNVVQDAEIRRYVIQEFGWAGWAVRVRP